MDAHTYWYSLIISFVIKRTAPVGARAEANY